MSLNRVAQGLMNFKVCQFDRLCNAKQVVGVTAAVT